MAEPGLTPRSEFELGHECRVGPEDLDRVAAACPAQFEQLVRPGQLVRRAPLELDALAAEAHCHGFGLRRPGGKANRGLVDLGRARDAVHDPLERPDERPVCRDERRGFRDVSRAGDGMERDVAHLLSALS